MNRLIENKNFLDNLIQNSKKKKLLKAVSEEELKAIVEIIINAKFYLTKLEIKNLKLGKVFAFFEKKKILNFKKSTALLQTEVKGLVKLLKSMVLRLQELHILDCMSQDDLSDESDSV